MFGQIQAHKGNSLLEIIREISEIKSVFFCSKLKKKIQPYFCPSISSFSRLKEGEDDDGGVAGQEDENMPGGVEVGKPQAGPERTEDTIVDPADHGQHPEENAAAAWNFLINKLN